MCCGQRLHNVLSSAAGLILKGSGHIALGFNPRKRAIRESKPRTGRRRERLRIAVVPLGLLSRRTKHRRLKPAATCPCPVGTDCNAVHWHIVHAQTLGKSVSVTVGHFGARDPHGQARFDSQASNSDPEAIGIGYRNVARFVPRSIRCFELAAAITGSRSFVARLSPFSASTSALRPHSRPPSAPAVRTR